MRKVLCPNCDSHFTICPECGARYHHGASVRCQKKECQEVNAPLDCAGCGLVVEDKGRGVLTFDMELIEYH